ncbi:sigma-70 family RNA polymerase sigma factor [Lachnospiraceae bacterium OttesenSCG-928-D06]|nr:sigma-70 family RNA polymerase sigma factor [Lachnospiraceae bacterium OttesenSCG-928-D06]
MKDPTELRVQNQFGGFCTRVLKNEAVRIHNEYAKQRDREKSIDDLTPSELSQLATTDKPFMSEHVFAVLGNPVVVTGDLLAEAIAKLPADKRDIILLSYFLGMTDREISEQLQVVRQTISKRRAKTLKELRDYLEKEGFEWPEI